MSKAIQQSLTSIASRWPRDQIRPTLQFAEAIQSASGRIFSGGRELGGKELEAAQRAVKSLERLLEGKAARDYPITDKTLKPASFPNHYSRMRAAVDRLERGETEKRGWMSWLNFRWQ